MLFVVKKGIVKVKGVFYPKGSFFDADQVDVKGLIDSGAIGHVVDVPAKETNEQNLGSDAKRKADMTIEELKQFLEEASVEEVKELLQAELSKPEPRKTAVKLLQEWLEDTDVQPPSLDADDVIVR